VIRFRAGDEEHVLRIGDTTPIGGGSYARVEGRDAVVTIPTFKATSFDKSLADLRERRIVALDTAAVERVEVGWPDGGVTLERVASGDPSPQGEGAAEDAEDAEDEETPAEDDRAWRVVEPIEGRADGEVVNDLISDLSFLRATGFVDDPSDEQLADLEAPDLTVRLTGGASESGPPLQWTLRIGPVYDGDKRLVQVEPPSDPARGESGRSDASGDPQPVPAKSPSLYTIAAERMNDFPRQLVGYRFKRLTDFRIGDAAQVDFFFHPASGDPVAITARRSEDGWSASPEPMTPGKVARMVSELSSLQAVDIVSEQGSPEELESLGLSPPRTILSVFGESESESEEGDEGDEGEEASLPRLAEIHLGRVEGSEWIAARSAGDPAIYRLGYELAEHVPVSLEALRNRFLSDEDEAPAAEDDAGTPLDFLNPREESP
jgi:hypothetical protein